MQREMPEHIKLNPDMAQVPCYQASRGHGNAAQTKHFADIARVHE
jgi:hypothetical protein